MKKLADAHKQADQLLAEIAAAKSELDGINQSWNAAVHELERQYGERAKQAKSKLQDLEKRLTKHAKTYQSEIFDGRDRIDLPTGALLHSVTLRVKRAKAVTPERLEELGYTDGVRIEKKVCWEQLETWPDERLIQAGTERVRKESIEYELKGRS